MTVAAVRGNIKVRSGIVEIDAFLADSVTTAEGKLYAQGAGWNIIHTQAMPMRHPRIGIGFIVRVPYTATNQMHSFQLYLLDADGHEMALGEAPSKTEHGTADGKVRRLAGTFNVGRPPTLQPGDEQLITFAVNVDGVEFDRADSYRFVLELDGSPEKELPFRVSQILQPTPILG